MSDYDDRLDREDLEAENVRLRAELAVWQERAERAAMNAGCPPSTPASRGSDIPLCRMWYAEKLQAEAEVRNLCAELDDYSKWLRAERAVIARVREVLTDHDDCTCQVRGHGCEHMWNEMREVFRPALDGGTE